MHLSSFLPVVLLAAVVEAAPFQTVRTMLERRGHHDGPGHDNRKAAHAGNLATRRRGPMPPIGTPEWKAMYPPMDQIPTDIPQEWLDALRSVEARGLIPGPDVNPIATLWPDGTRSYGDFKATDPNICNNGMGCGSTTDTYFAPEGMLGVSQDDGPLGPGVRLYEFFSQHSIPSSHFYTGSNILRNFGVFLQALHTPNQHFAPHGWSHQYTTTLTNEQVVAEIGWTMRILAENNGGLIPCHWRPPYGDVDERVRAIAREVFGLRTIIWYPDPQDYFIHTGQVSKQAVIDSFTKSLNGPKSPGLIPLEHVLSVEAVDVFMEVYPTMVEQGWNVTNIPGVWPDERWYKNSAHTGTSGEPAVDPGLEGMSIVSPRLAEGNGFAPDWHEEFHQLNGRSISRGGGGKKGAAAGSRGSTTGVSGKGEMGEVMWKAGLWAGVVAGAWGAYKGRSGRVMQVVGVCAVLGLILG